MPSHARPKTGRLPRTALRVGLVISAAGAAVTAGGAATAGATVVPVTKSDVSATKSALTGAVLHGTAGSVGPVKNLQLDPFAKTSVDPLTNSVGTQVADFKPVTTADLTRNLTRGAALRDLPLVGKASRGLPG
ncbi:hypothetical protein AB0C96_30185 [Streptomyces sp. NPDC048506]|uniref:hypothetical protein n=1 Tax=Streptomyces sp. NPDC048506 TaxID=3155028 RepID=UPI003424BFBE